MFLFISVIEAHTVIMNDTITLSLRPLYTGPFGGVAGGGGGDGVFSWSGGSAVDINENSLREQILNKLCI